MTTNTKERTSLVNKFLNGVEKVVINYQTLQCFLLNVCWLSRYHLDFVSFDVSVKHPGNGETIHIKVFLVLKVSL